MASEAAVKRDESTEIIEMVETMYHDVSQAADACSASDSPFHRRSLVRAVFAYVESTTFMLKQQCLAREARKPGLFTFEEMALLREETFVLDNQAFPSAQPKFLPTDANFRFTIRLWARDTQPDYSLDVSNNGWNLFRKALHIRHRITHPKGIAGLDISNEEMQIVHGAWLWVRKVLHDVMLAATLSYEGEIERLKAEYAQVKTVAEDLHKSRRNS